MTQDGTQEKRSLREPIGDDGVDVLVLHVARQGVGADEDGEEPSQPQPCQAAGSFSQSAVAEKPGVTPSERERPTASLAARFAAKEALAKALGAPVGMSWLDAEVVSESSGRPRLEVTGTVAAQAQALGVTSVHLSLSHDAGIASAVVILES